MSTRKAKFRAPAFHDHCYVVIGIAGDYEDKSWWIVRGFTTLPAANDYADRAAMCGSEIIERERERWQPYWDDATGNVPEPPKESETNPFDPDMWKHCGGDVPRYAVQTVEICR